MSTPGQEKIFIIDQIKTKPGKGEAFLKAYMEKYAAHAHDRMKHEFTWVAPPMWLKDQSNTLYIIWSVQGAGAWWANSQQSRRIDAVTQWWQDADKMVETRDRIFASDVADIASLTNV